MKIVIFLDTLTLIVDFSSVLKEASQISNQACIVFYHQFLGISLLCACKPYLCYQAFFSN